MHLLSLFCISLTIILYIKYVDTRQTWFEIIFVFFNDPTFVTHIHENYDDYRKNFNLVMTSTIMSIGI